jgi:hypothetical protein
LGYDKVPIDGVTNNFPPVSVRSVTNTDRRAAWISEVDPDAPARIRRLAVAQSRPSPDLPLIDLVLPLPVPAQSSIARCSKLLVKAQADNDLQAEKNNFFKNSPKIACQAP